MSKTTQLKFTETAVRKMRDQVLESKTSDENWDACKENWMKPDAAAWLQARCEKLKKTS